MGKTAKIHDITKKELAKEPVAREYFSPFAEMERMMENIFSRNAFWPSLFEFPQFRRLGWDFAERLPAIDIIDQDEVLLVKAELPGVQKDQLEVTLTDNTLTIKASVKQEKKEEKKDYYRSEISSNAFRRTVTLPCAVAADKIKASFNNGLLELSIPKLEKANKHSIKID